jgi:glycosyltransferase involved in cell wall biosynthesis
MANRHPLISVICCAHNEEEYIDKSIPSLLKALQGIPAEVLFVADRCTDNTVAAAKKYDVKVIEKTWKKWKNSYAEALQTGYMEAKGTYVSIIDADIALPTNFFRALLPMVRGDIASVAAEVVTYPDTFWNRVFYAWEKTYNIAPLGKEPQGAARIILTSALDKIGGFQDVPAPDTNLDIRLVKEGYKSVAVSAMKTYHLRQLSLRKMISGQIRTGRARYALGLSFKRTMGHSILRVRPLILQGWMLERMNRKTAEKKPTKNS